MKNLNPYRSSLTYYRPFSRNNWSFNHSRIKMCLCNEFTVFWRSRLIWGNMRNKNVYAKRIFRFGSDIHSLYWITQLVEKETERIFRAIMDGKLNVGYSLCSMQKEVITSRWFNGLIYLLRSLWYLIAKYFTIYWLLCISVTLDFSSIWFLEFNIIFNYPSHSTDSKRDGEAATQ